MEYQFYFLSYFRLLYGPRHRNRGKISFESWFFGIVRALTWPKIWILDQSITFYTNSAGQIKKEKDQKVN